MGGTASLVNGQGQVKAITGGQGDVASDAWLCVGIRKGEGL